MKRNAKLRLLRRVLRHGGLLTLVVALAALYAVVAGVSLGMILPFADLLFGGGPEAVQLAEGAGPLDQLRFRIQDRATEWFFHGDSRDALRMVCVFLLGAFALKGILGFLRFFA